MVCTCGVSSVDDSDLRIVSLGNSAYACSLHSTLIEPLCTRTRNLAQVGPEALEVLEDGCRPRHLVLHDTGASHGGRLELLLDANSRRWSKDRYGRDQASWASYVNLDPPRPVPTSIRPVL